MTAPAADPGGPGGAEEAPASQGVAGRAAGGPPVPREPSGPSPHGARLRRSWVLGWATVAAVGASGVGVLWAANVRVELLALACAALAAAVAVPLHHLVVTQDGGEQRVARPDTSRVDLPALLDRRHLIGGGVTLGVSLAVATLGLRWFGPRRPTATAWGAGERLVTLTGGPLRPDDIPVGGVVTAWPERAAGTERAAVMVIRLREPPLEAPRMDGVVDGTLVAYSRLCTHAGCAVALYRDHDQALFCPCHQATFDVRRGAVPTGGPASVPLPQLPLRIGEDGTLHAAGELSGRPGPVGGTARP